MSCWDDPCISVIFWFIEWSRNIYDVIIEGKHVWDRIKHCCCTLQKWVLSIELSWSLFVLSRNDGHLRSPKDLCCISGVDLSRSPFVIFLVWCELLLSNFHLRTFTLVFLCDACLLRTAFICCLHCFPCLHKENLKLPLHFQCPGTILGYWDCALWSLVYSGNPLGSVPYIITFLDFFNRNGTELQFLLLINVFV